MEEHKLSEPQTFAKAGKALLTVENSRAGNRFTFKVSSVLSGPDNESAYRYIGAFRRTKRSRVSRKPAQDKFQQQAA